MANLDQSLELKNQDLNAAIDNAEAIVNNPDSSPEEITAATDAVKKIQEAIKNLQTLKSAAPKTSESSSESLADSNSESGSESVESDSTSSSDSEDDSARALSDSSESESDSQSDSTLNSQNMEENRNMPVKVEGATVPKTKEETLKEQRSAINDFIRSDGEKRDGLISSDVGVLIPIEIIYDPSLEVKTVYDLASLVTKTKVKTKSGNYPILKKPTTTLPTVAELEANPTLAKPEFLDVKWDVDTYRGAVPVSQESLDDAQVDLSALIADFVQQIKLNTTNKQIAAVLAGFTKGTVAAATLIDDLKTIVNATMDVAYAKQFVITQSLFNTLDKLKDGEGRYYLQPNVAQGTGFTFLGLKVTVVNDDAFGGKAGAQQLWVGDLKRAVLYADRAEVAIQWVWNEIYGKYLQAVIRFDVEKADGNAGYFVDLTPSGA
jgi:HK97 family phage major capsid protein